MTVASTAVRVAGLVLDGDYSDPDVIRTGDDYWMVTSTIHCSPGMAVLTSTDLRRWRHVGHAIADLRLLGPAYSHEQMGSRFGRGVYAGSLRFHDGRFWVHFTTLDEGIFVTTAAHPAGPWTPPHRLSAERMWDDPCPLWDDDGRAWLVASNPGPRRWFSYLIPMAPDGMSVAMDERQVVDDWHTSEGNKIYRRDGWYLLLHNEVRAPGDRVVVLMRSQSLAGPWEKRVLLRGLGPDRAREPNQGALVDHADGSWSFVTHHGRCGYPEGRPLSVWPVTWQNGWPVVHGDAGPGLLARSPDVVLNRPAGDETGLQRDDDFSADTLGPQWEWTNAPVNGSWSLTERPGALRLHCRPTARGDGLVTAATLLTQRVAARPGTTTVQLDAAGLSEGAVAGLCHYSTSHPVGIGVQRHHGALLPVVVQGGEVSRSEPGAALPERVWLRSDISARSFATLSWSVDGETFTPLGDSYPLRWSSFRGSRIGLFAYREQGVAGVADFAGFRYRLD